MGIEKIIAITGKPGLYQILNQSKGAVITQCLTTGKKTNVSFRQEIHSLSEITVFTDDEEMKLDALFAHIYRHQEGKSISTDIKTNDAKLKFLLEIVPNLDIDKFYPSHAKKVVNWYNILTENGYLKEIIQAKESNEDNDSGEISDPTTE